MYASQHTNYFFSPFTSIDTKKSQLSAKILTVNISNDQVKWKFGEWFITFKLFCMRTNKLYFIFKPGNFEKLKHAVLLRFFLFLYTTRGDKRNMPIGVSGQLNADFCLYILCFRLLFVWAIGPRIYTEN